MCLILFAYDDHGEGNHGAASLIVAANRDEFYARPAAVAHYWSDAEGVFAGRDLRAGGTWLGVTTAGRFAAITNFSEAANGEKPGSRGDLPRHFLLTAGTGALDYARRIDSARYAGFSLLLFDGDELAYLSNRSGDGPRRLGPGIYGLANTHLNSDWPKVRRGKEALRRAIENGVDADALLALLADEHQPPDSELPQRGRDPAFERRVAPCFLRGQQYGTRASSAVVMRRDGIEFTERNFGPNGKPLARVSEELPLAPPATAASSRLDRNPAPHGRALP